MLSRRNVVVMLTFIVTYNQCSIYVFAAYYLPRIR